MEENESASVEQVGQPQGAASVVNGTLSCFCEAEWAKEGWSKSAFGTYGFKSRQSGDGEGGSMS